MNNGEQPILTKKQRRELKRQEKIEQLSKSVRTSKIKKITIWAAVVIIIAGVGWLIFYSSGRGPKDVPPDNDPITGNSQAKLVINEFSDFSCPACKVAASTVREVVNGYSDKVKLVYNNFNIGHRWSEKSAEAGECAFDQGKFWEFYDLVFQKQDEWANADNAVEKIKSYAKQLGLDENKFSSCLDSKETKDKVAYDMKEGQAKQVISTPTFFIGSQKVVGAKSLDEFKAIIDEELKKL